MGQVAAEPNLASDEFFVKVEQCQVVDFIVDDLRL